MALARVKFLLRRTNITTTSTLETRLSSRSVTTTPSGGLLPEPKKTPFGLVGIVCAVIPGLLIGATISKNMANFLEENELFVPSDDDDDDDD